MDSVKIGELIKEIRKKNNLTQKDLADKYNVSYQAVSKWENGKNLPDITLLHQICLDYNIDFSLMVNGINKKKKINKKWYFIISIIIILLIIMFFIFKKNNTFEFKTISTSCHDFDVAGSLAFDSNHSTIYISNIIYCGKQNLNTYQKIEYLLYEKNNNTKTEIYKDELSKINSSLEEYLKEISIKVDNYEKTCKTYKENNLYLEIKAYDAEDKIKIFTIPLTLDKSCKK